MVRWLSVDEFRQGIERLWWETLTNVRNRRTVDSGAYLDPPLRRIVAGYMGDAVNVLAIC
jgi:hypothetical protein